MEKRIEVVNLKASDLKFGFGNPRKITKEKKAELKKSIDMSGDFGCFIIDEGYNVIGGNQRARIMQEFYPDREVLCKMMIGYTVSELKAINIRDNTHSGEWDLDKLAEWTADINIDFGFDTKSKDGQNPGSADNMDLIGYEKYDYVLLACRTSIAYEKLIEALGLTDKRVEIGEKNHKTIRARAIWFDDEKFEIVRKGE